MGAPENGELLDAAEESGFDVLLSGDKTIRHEQNLTGRLIALIYMSDNHWPIIEHYVQAIVKSINMVQPGEVKAVYCGTFSHKKSQ